ncbi:hypothetical protein ACQYRI_16160 [Salmonella enterica]
MFKKNRHDCLSSGGVNQPDLSELYSLTGHQTAIVDAMIPTLLKALADDIEELKLIEENGNIAQIATLAHRMKSSWFLLGMHHARCKCMIMERLPELITDGAIPLQQVEKSGQRFLIAMEENYRSVTQQLGY